MTDAERQRQKCLIDGCDRMEELVHGRPAGGLCAGHRHRKKRGLDLTRPLDPSKSHRLSHWQMLHEAAVVLALAEEEAYQRALDRLRKAAVRYGQRLLRRRRRRGRAPSIARR